MGDRLRDLGLLLLRLGMGLAFMGHGWPKLASGSSGWAKLGASTRHLGIDVAPMFFGFAAAFAEFFGGLLIAVGLLFRPALVLLVATMGVAVARHLGEGDSFRQWSHAAEAGVVFSALLLTGPGRYVLTALRRG